MNDLFLFPENIILSFSKISRLSSVGSVFFSDKLFISIAANLLATIS